MRTEYMNDQRYCRGTSWGAIPFPGVYSKLIRHRKLSRADAHNVWTASYDYGSAIKETRQLTDKYSELKRQGLFLRSSPEFYKTDWVGNSSTGVMAVSSPSAFVVHLKNPDTNASFYVVRQSNSSSMSVVIHYDGFLFGDTFSALAKRFLSTSM